MPNAALADQAQRPEPFGSIELQIKDLREVGDVGHITGIATTPTPDRMGDIVEPGGASFALPLPLLLNHDSKDPIGVVTAATVTEAGIEVRAEIRMVTRFIRDTFEKMKAGLFRGLSIGFRELSGVPLDPKAPWDGWRFLSWEWLELSVVTIPANPDASINAIKAFDATGRAHASAAAQPPGAPAQTPAPQVKRAPAQRPAPIGVKAMPQAAERIEQLEREVAAHQKAIDTIFEACEVEGRDPDDNETADIQVAKAAGEKAAASLATWRERETAAVQRAVAANDQRGAAILNFPSKKRDPGDFLVKSAMVKLVAHIQRGVSPDAIAESLIRNDNEALTVVKSIVNPAQTLVPGWAQELTREDTRGFMGLLSDDLLYTQLAARGMELEFNGARSITIPGRTPTPTVSGSFVGEAQMIPVKRLGLTSQTLNAYKMAVISTYSREIFEQSTPNIETLLREQITFDTGFAIDAALLSSAPMVPNVKPPGLFVGIQTTASTGNTFEAILADVRTMTKWVSQHRAQQPVWLMNRDTVTGLAMLTNAVGVFQFKDELAAGTFFGYPVLASNTVPEDIVALVDAKDFVSTFDGPNFSVSDQATIVEVDDDGTPPYIATAVPLPPPAAAITSVDDAVSSTPVGPVRSLYQTDALALRMLMPLSWALLRPTNSYLLTGVNW